MTKEQANFFKCALDNDDIYPVEIRDNYSGRGMFGKTTFAIATDSVSDLIPALCVRPRKIQNQCQIFQFLN